MSPDERFDAFAAKVRSLWSTHRISEDELRTRVWDARLCRVQIDVLARALAQHAADAPDAVRPNWSIVYRIIGEQSATGKSDLEILIAQYRHDRDATRRQKFEAMSDEEIWRHYVEVQIYPVMFGLGGSFRHDIDDAIKMGNQKARMLVESMIVQIEDNGQKPPEWIMDVGIPDRWLVACAHESNRRAGVIGGV